MILPMNPLVLVKAASNNLLLPKQFSSHFLDGNQGAPATSQVYMYTWNFT